MRAGGRTQALLDVLMALSTTAGIAWCALLVVEMDDRARSIGFAVLVVSMVVCWVLLRRRRSTGGRPVGAAVFVLLGVAAPFVGDGPFTLPLFLMSLLVAASVFGPRVATVLVAVGLVGQVVALVVIGGGLVQSVLQLIATAFVFTFGLALAWLTAAHERQHREIQALVEQVRRGARTEAELMLADERTRAARDLHDGLGHRLTVITMALQFAERMTDREPARAREQVARARIEATEAIATMRRWVRALSPVRTEGAGLADTLDAIAESFRGTGLVVDVSTRLPVDRAPGPAAALLCFRVVQEGLTNALRHAAPTRVDVDVHVEDDHLHVSVADDGSPPDEECAPAAIGFGLHSLQDRARQLGGRVDTVRGDRGWTLVARLPLTEPMVETS